MKKFKLYFGISLTIVGVVIIAKGSFLGGLLISLVGAMLIPKISEIIKEKLAIWQKKTVRISTYIGFFLLAIIIAGTQIGGNNQGVDKEVSENANNLYDSYKKEMDNHLSQFTEEEKSQREKLIIELKSNTVYQQLVDSGIVSTEYIPLINAIGNGISNIKKDGFSIDERLYQQVLDSKDGNDKAEFVIKSIGISQPQKGGLSMELIKVFEAYKNRFKYYGEAGFIYNANGNNEEKVEYDYDFTPIFGVLDPKNQNVLNAIYEAKQKGFSQWNEEGDYIYNYIATNTGYNQYVKQVYPNSPYVVNADYELTANQLYSAYNNNEIAADNKYKGKKIAVTGGIYNISEVLGSITIDLYSGDEIGWTTISCTVKDRDIVSQLSKGQKVTIIGTCQGMTLNVSINLENCIVWKY